MKLALRLVLALVVCLIVYSEGSASERDSVIHRIGVDARGGYAMSSFKDDILKDMVHSDDAKRTTLAASLHLKYSFSFNPSSEMGRFFPGSYQGLGVAYNTFGNRKGLGAPVSVYALQGAPVWHISDRLSLDYEWNFGASFGWKPCKSGDDYPDIDAMSNLIVGSKVNAYINIGVMLRWRVTDHWALTAGIDLTHYSNGNTSFPNPGVNLAGLRIGATRSFGKEPFRTRQLPDTTRLKHRISYDLTAYGAWRKRVYRGGEEPILMRGHFPVAGLSFAPMYEVARIFRAGVSADFQWDKSTDLRRHYMSGDSSDDLRFNRVPFFSQVCAGLSARVELVMPYMSINAGIGYNVVGPEETRASYQLANLRVYITKGLYANIGYQLLNFSKQNNLMLGLGYTFRGNRPAASALIH